MNMEKLKNNSILSVVALSMKISFSASAILATIRIICTLLNSILPTIKLLLMKCIIDALTNRQREETIKYVIVYIVLILGGVIVDKINSYCILLHSEKIGLNVSNSIIDKVVDLDISYFDTPSLYDEMNIATANGGSISNLFWGFASIVQGIIQFAVSFGILCKLKPVYAVVLTVTSIPFFFVEQHNGVESYLWNRENENKVRKINYLYRVFVDKYFAVDLRVNSLIQYMRKKYNQSWNDWFAGKRKLVSNQFLKSFFAVFLSNIVAMGFVVVMAYDVLYNNFTIGDFTYYLGISTQLITYTYFVLSSLAAFKQLRLKTSGYYDFMNWRSCLDKDGEMTCSDGLKSLRFENVSFRYPNCEDTVLHNVSFEIKQGDKILLIGNNGSGKSTILKLILRLYEPSEGTIYLNGKPLREYSDKEFKALFSLLPQNYVNYAFSIKENIAGSDNVNEQRVLDSISMADMDNILEKLPKGIETYLTKQFDIEGVELSVGEWQKMAMARFFYKDADVKILDEPSSSMDVFAHDKTLAQVLKKKDSTVFLISHRLIDYRNIDRVISLENGRVVEDDAPDILRTKGGMFSSWLKTSAVDNGDNQFSSQILQGS